MLSTTSHATFCGAVIRLEGWGLPVGEVSALAASLNEMLPGFHCHAGEASPAGALTLVLVDIVALTGESGRGVWNTHGPVDAMREALQEGRPAIAVCRGRISDLPVQRKGVWVSGAADWRSRLVTLVRALATLEWTPQRGYQDMSGWAGVRELARRDLLSVTYTDQNEANFERLLRSATAASLMPAVALLAAGVAQAVFNRTLLEAGLHDTALAAVAPMTLDGVMRVDGLIGFDWSSAGQPASASKYPRR